MCNAGYDINQVFVGGGAVGKPQGLRVAEAVAVAVGCGSGEPVAAIGDSDVECPCCPHGHPYQPRFPPRI